MASHAHILLVIALAALAVPQVAHGEEVLPSLSDEKMGEYKNAFGKAISDSLGGASNGVAPGQNGGTGRPDSGLTTVTKRMRDDFDQKGPPPGQGQGQGPQRPPGGGFQPGPPGGIPGGPGGGSPPPGLGGPGQPGGPRPPPPGGGGGGGGPGPAPH